MTPQQLLLRLGASIAANKADKLFPAIIGVFLIFVTLPVLLTTFLFTFMPFNEGLDKPNVDSATYKMVADHIGTDWVEMIAFDKSRYDNDFSLADAHNSAFDYLVLRVKEYKEETRERFKGYKTVIRNGVEYTIPVYENYTVKVLVKQKVYTSNVSLKKFARSNGLSQTNVIDFYDGALAMNDDLYVVEMNTKDIYDLLNTLNEEQLFLYNLTLEMNMIPSMLNEYFDIPDHIPIYNAGTFAHPTPSVTRISSPYGMRYHPILHKNVMHTGVDFASNGCLGEPIISTAEGVIVKVEYKSTGYGYNVTVEHEIDGETWQSRYSHMNQISVSEGQVVDQGTVLGAIGNTGRSTGAHLHFELKYNGGFVDPMRYIR